ACRGRATRSASNFCNIRNRCCAISEGTQARKQHRREKHEVDFGAVHSRGPQAQSAPSPACGGGGGRGGACANLFVRPPPVPPPPTGGGAVVHGVSPTGDPTLPWPAPSPPP